jgi:hypothetical protein
LGSRQIEAFKSHSHGFSDAKASTNGVRNYPVYSNSADPTNPIPTAVTNSGGSETRPGNAAYAPRIHA